MGWSWPDLEATPDAVVERVMVLMSETAQREDPSPVVPVTEERRTQAKMAAAAVVL